MTVRHIIVEGPDGAGKSTLVDFLCQHTKLVRHMRASDSVTGPVKSLGDWFHKDYELMGEHAPSVYDRHPLISEPIYARWARKQNPQVPFGDVTWLHHMRLELAGHVFVVWCLPPLYVVYDNVRRSAQMPGVVEGIHDIYAAYRHVANGWPGPQCWFNYESQKLTAILGRIRPWMKGVLA